jgi:hypothetical protein
VGTHSNRHLRPGATSDRIAGRASSLATAAAASGVGVEGLLNWYPR